MVVQWLVCLPLDPKAVGSNPAKAIKIISTPSFGWEVKPEGLMI
jgi:hypothetical protein